MRRARPASRRSPRFRDPPVRPAARNYPPGVIGEARRGRVCPVTGNAGARPSGRPIARPVARRVWRARRSRSRVFRRRAGPRRPSWCRACSLGFSRKTFMLTGVQTPRHAKCAAPNSCSRGQTLGPVDHAVQVRAAVRYRRPCGRPCTWRTLLARRRVGRRKQLFKRPASASATASSPLRDGWYRPGSLLAACVPRARMKIAGRPGGQKKDQQRSADRAQRLGYRHRVEHLGRFALYPSFARYLPASPAVFKV